MGCFLRWRLETACGPLAGLRRPDPPWPCRVAELRPAPRRHPPPPPGQLSSHVAASHPGPLQGPLGDLIHVDLENVPFVLEERASFCLPRYPNCHPSARNCGAVPISGVGVRVSLPSSGRVSRCLSLCISWASCRCSVFYLLLSMGLLFSLHNAFTLNLFSCLFIKAIAQLPFGGRFSIFCVRVF